MTISRTLRTRLRRYALFCFMAASSAAFVAAPTNSKAADTHDSGALQRDSQAASTGRCTPGPDYAYDETLCGWVEESRNPAACTKVCDKGQTTDQAVAEADSGARETPPPQFFAVELDGELIIDTCNYDDWLAGTVSTVQDSEPRSSNPVASSAASRTSSRFNSAIATIAAAATAGNPIRFGEWTEPFAMIGPAGGHTVKEIESFQAWFVEGGRVLADFVPVVDFSGEIVSSDESIALESNESSVPESEPVQEIAVDPLVGSSPFIATIEEAYSPYDLAQNDRPDQSDVTAEPAATGSAETDRDDADNAPAELVWSDGLFSPQHQPFCIRSLAVMRRPGWSPLSKSVPVGTLGVSQVSPKASPGDAPSATAAIVVADPRIVGSADCLLDEWIWNVSVTLEEERVTDEWLRPVRIGNRVASLVVSGDRLTSKVVSELALVWPAAAQPAKPIPGIGARLLARAEAAEQLPEKGLAKPFTEQQLAQANAMFWQWVDVAQSVFDDVADHLDDVTEVARNRGTQDDSTRR